MKRRRVFDTGEAVCGGEWLRNPADMVDEASDRLGVFANWLDEWREQHARAQTLLELDLLDTAAEDALWRRGRLLRDALRAVSTQRDENVG